MKKLILTKCKICNETKTPRGLAQHIQKSHNISLTDYIVKFEFNGEHPKCLCGCGEKVTIRGYQIMDYVNYHSPEGKLKKGEKLEFDYEKWKKNVTEGIRKYNKEAKERDPNYRSGKNSNFFGKKVKESTKEKLRKAVEKQIAEKRHPFIGRDNGRIKKSSLEVKFENYLKNNNIKYESSYRVQYIKNNKEPRNKYYDFYIPEINSLVEIHGSYWHPKKDINLSNIQKKNFLNDKFKKQLAKNNFFKLLTIYDYELESFIEENILTKILNSFKTMKIDLSCAGFIDKTSSTIDLPDHWTGLVDEETITVNLTPVGGPQQVWVEEVRDNKVILGGDITKCYYMVLGERKDIDKLIVEY
jgi:hypothetical protein